MGKSHMCSGREIGAVVETCIVGDERGRVLRKKMKRNAIYNMNHYYVVRLMSYGLLASAVEGETRMHNLGRYPYS
jgi:hypothetical protein